MNRETAQPDTTSWPVHTRVVSSFEEPHDGKNKAGLAENGIIGLHFSSGQWQTKSQFVFDPHEKSLTRRTYTVCNSSPLRDLDFSWTPDAVGPDAPGRIWGAGRLVWRPKGKPAYDQSSIYAEYKGEMTDGKPNGRGTYLDQSGLCYEGEWSEGKFEGIGRLQLPNGDEYIGTFHRGRADGEGRYIKADGEIYTGDFRAGLRSGSATILLPSGASYQSQWVAGQEIPESHRVRFAQLGNYASGPDSDDVRIGIALDRSPIRSGMLSYSASNTADGLVIGPADKRLMDIWKGSGDIMLANRDMDPGRGGIFFFNSDQRGLDIWPASGLPPVLFVLNVENRGSNSIQVVDAYLDVAASSVDLQPMVIATVEACGPDYNPRFTIENFGWGPLEQTSLRLSFAGSSHLSHLSEQAWSKELGLIHTSVTVDLEENLRAAGVDVAALKRHTESFSCKSKSQADCFSEVLRSGLFGSLESHVTRDDFYIRLNLPGILEYKWQDSEGRLHDRRSPIKVSLVLATLVHSAECEGGQIDAIHTKKPLMLKLDQVRYKLPIDLRSNVAAGRVERYLLPIRAPKASHHNYRVVLVLSDGREIKSRPVNLLFFVPNMWGRKLNQ